jgi:dihydroorotate dehydrogenase (NAD+) catalytic subunit
VNHSEELPRYDPAQSYDWNYDHAPDDVADVDLPPMPGVHDGGWRYCGLPVASPLGVAAGPLLNGRWLLYYASLGFDVLTYKTVRSVARACYGMPNLQPVDCSRMDATRGDGQVDQRVTSLPACDAMHGTWAVSFGMPSKLPEIWRADIAATRRRLPPEKVLSVSVVGTVQDGWSLDQLADDYAQCARWAVEAGADAIETNFSCPNVSSCDGQLFQQPADAAVVAARVRAAIGDAPLVVKIGCVGDDDEAARLVEALAPSISGLAMTNSVATTVHGADGGLLFEGAKRGICGRAIREASLAQVDRFARLRNRQGLAFSIIGCGGASTAEDVRRYLSAGADAVHIATAAMVDPGVAMAIRGGLPGDPNPSP